MTELNILGWYYYLSGEEEKLDQEKCGKWMHFFTDQEFAKEICKKAIEEGACYECKCTDMSMPNPGSGVICFYANGDDVENHRRIIEFMLSNDLIQKTRSGRYYNISFKFDAQTRAMEYGPDFKGKLTLDQFIDLKTGAWIHE